MNFARDEFVLQLNMQTTVLREHSTIPGSSADDSAAASHLRNHALRWLVPVRVAAYTSAEDEPSERRNVPGAVLDLCKTSSKEHYGDAAADFGRSRVKSCSNMSIIRGSVRLTAVFLQRVLS